MADAATDAPAPMEVVVDGGAPRDSVLMPLATELTAGAAGIGDGGPEEVGGWLLVGVSG